MPYARCDRLLARPNQGQDGYVEERTDARVSIGAAGSIHFGFFELDVRAHELRRDGRVVRLQEQPFHILRMLVERPGEIVLREEIRKQLWPNDIMVEFDQGINAAVKRLRDALRDSADKPRYIETIPRQGYRFICPVEALEHGPAGVLETAAALAPIANTDRAIQEPPEAPRAKSRRLWALVAVLAVVISVITWRVMRPTEPVLQPLVRLDVDLGGDVSLGLTASVHRFRGTDTILSPDGTRMVYVSRSRLFGGSMSRRRSNFLERNMRMLLSSHQTGSGLHSSRVGS
jgi:DNA-binding winged helix-turn-helix (wHTH) protein